MTKGEEQLRRIYAYLVDMQEQAYRTSMSVFFPDIADECKWYSDVYEDAKNVVDEVLEGKWQVQI